MKSPLFIITTVLYFASEISSAHKISENFKKEIIHLIQTPRTPGKQDLIGESLPSPEEFYFDPRFVLNEFKNGNLLQNSSQCLSDLYNFLKSLLNNREYWAIQMLDSFGKPGSGITQGNLKWPGSFSLCNSIVQNSTRENPFEGQYCRGDFLIHNASSNPVIGNSIPLSIGFCFPSTCSSKEVEGFLQIPFSINGSISVSTECIPKTRDMWKDSKVIGWFIFCLIIGFLIITATLYDLILNFQSNITGLPKSEALDENCCDSDVELLTDFHEGNTVLLSKFGRFILCFSLYTNASKLFSLRPNQDTLSCLNGIRVFSMLWVILGHVYAFCGGLSDNILVALEWLNKFSFCLIESAQFAVDSFFLLSGFLVTYLFLKEYNRNEGKISWIKFYVHRYLRLTPVYIILLFTSEDAFSKYYSNGPFWPQNGLYNGTCGKYWWSNMLYINNFVDNGLQCMGHTWYLANDMQFFVISPLILIFLARNRFPIAAVISGVLILASWITTGVLSTIYSASPDIQLDLNEEKNDSFTKIYVKPYCRIAPYIIGMLCGYAVYKSQCKSRINKVFVGIGWLAAIALSSSVVFGTYHAHMNVQVSALYTALSRSTWALALAWMIFACCNGYGGVINSILSWPIWQPFARLTYTAYLVHISVIAVVLLSQDVVFHFSHTSVLLSFFGYSIISYILAIFVSLAFEAPFLQIEKLFTRSN